MNERPASSAKTPVPTYEIAIEIASIDAWRLIDALEAAPVAPVASGLTEREDGGWRAWAHYDRAPDASELARIIGAALAGRPPLSGLTIVRLPDEDWVARSQQALPLVRAGRFVVHGGHDRANVVHSRFAIEIEAGQAFGTAHHGSTRGCLLALDALAKRRRFQRALDLGTGSGILAIAAARLGARVIAGDIDPVAVKIAAANARANGVGGRVRTIGASGLSHRRMRRSPPFDLVLANILAKPLIALAPAIGRRSAARSVLILSGLTQDQARSVRAAYGMAGFAFVRSYRLGEWSTLVMRKQR